jgi:hypothetical protein
LTCNVNKQPTIEEWADVAFTHEFEATTAAKTYKYWIYNDTGETLNDTTAKDDIWLKVEYVKAYDDTSEYVIAEEYSTEIDIADAADADDWDYLSVASVTPAVASKVRVTCCVSYYNALATKNIFVDPAVVVT